jgi:signal transduction histidine kinase
MFKTFHRRLGVKIFFSYLIVILIGVVVLAIAVELALPRAFERHMGAGRGMMGGQGPMGRVMLTDFRSAVTEALGLSLVAAFLAAVVISAFVSRQVVAPVRSMMQASKNIAEGHYDLRIQVPAKGSLEDSDELAQLAHSFNQMAGNLQETEARRRQLIGDVAHELRTPITVIQGSLEGLIDGKLPADPDHLAQIYLEAERLTRLVNDLQELSRVEAGAYSLEKKAISVETLVADLKKRLGSQFEDKGVAFSADIPSSLPDVMADEGRIGQVLLNLAGNALQYTPTGGWVKVSAVPRNSEVWISVTDNGSGIPPEHLPHVFDRFYRVDKSRSRAGGGSGIGLTIARHLVEAHGGRIWVESSGPGQGSTFTFTLPTAYAQEGFRPRPPQWSSPPGV